MLINFFVYHVLPLCVVVCFFWNANRLVKMGLYLCTCAIVHPVFFKLTGRPIPIRTEMITEGGTILKVSVVLFAIGLLFLLAGKLYIKK